MNKHRDQRFLGRPAVLLLALAVAVWLCLSLTEAALAKRLCLDLNADGRSEEICLRGGHLELKGPKGEIWRSDPAWIVTDFLCGDINHDRKVEVLLLLNKRGSFGDAKPFWLKRDERFSQHLFIYQLRGERLQPLWHSSELRPEILSWSWADDERGLLRLRHPDEEGLWTWDGWGLSRVDRDPLAY